MNEKLIGEIMNLDKKGAEGRRDYQERANKIVENLVHLRTDELLNIYYAVREQGGDNLSNAMNIIARAYEDLTGESFSSYLDEYFFPEFPNTCKKKKNYELANEFDVNSHGEKIVVLPNEQIFLSGDDWSYVYSKANDAWEREKEGYKVLSPVSNFYNRDKALAFHGVVLGMNGKRTDKTKNVTRISEVIQDIAVLPDGRILAAQADRIDLVEYDSQVGFKNKQNQLFFGGKMENIKFMPGLELIFTHYNILEEGPGTLWRAKFHLKKPGQVDAELETKELINLNEFFAGDGAIDSIVMIDEFIKVKIGGRMYIFKQAKDLGWTMIHSRQHVKSSKLYPGGQLLYVLEDIEGAIYRTNLHQDPRTFLPIVRSSSKITDFQMNKNGKIYTYSDDGIIKIFDGEEVDE